MKKDRGQISLGNITAKIEKEIHNSQWVKEFSKIRESYLVWSGLAENENGDKYFYYRDDQDIFKLGDPSAVANCSYIWCETNPTDPDFPTDMPKIWSPGAGNCTGGTDPVPLEAQGEKTYMLYMFEETLYIRRYEPCAPDGPGYVTTLPRASILGDKFEIVYPGETEPPPGTPNTNINYIEWQANLTSVEVTTPLTIDSAVRLNAHYLRPSSDLANVGLNGEYNYRNDTPVVGLATITFARPLQVSDYIIISY